MKSLTGKFSSTRGWALLLILFLGAGLLVAACGDEEVPAPTTPAPPPAPPPPAPEPEPEPEKPATPTGLQVASKTASSITWTWNAVEGAHGYVVQASGDETFDETDQLALTIQPSYTATPLPADTSVYLRVAAGVLTAAAPSLDPSDYLLSDWTTHVTGTTDAAAAALAAPTNVRETDKGSNYIEWSWDAVSGAAGYHAQFSRTESFASPDADRPLLQNTSVRISNLPANTDGYLRVRAYTGSGTGQDTEFSDWSATDMASTGEAPPPPPATALDAPDGFQATERNDDSISLEWDSVEDAEFYEVEQRANDGDWVDASCGGGDAEVVETSCQATGLDEVTEYDFRVRAVPASSDTELTVSDWATLNNIETTGTRPPPPPMTIPGSEDHLNLIWESEDDSIMWRWDQVADRTWKYQVYYVEQAYNSKANPCPDPDLTYAATVDGASASTNGWTPAVADGFATRHEHETGLQAGDVALLCVQTVREAARGQTQYGNLSFVWAATTPVDPTDPTAPVQKFKEDKGKTTAITWGSVTFDQGFDYAIRLVSAPPVEDSTAGTSAPATAPDQDACAAGKPLRTEDSGNRAEFPLTAYEVTGLTDYTSYHMCYRAQNDDGSSHSEWAVSTGGVTLPSQPGSISGPTVDHDDDPKWSFAIPATGHPQETSSYTIQVIVESDASLAGASGLSRPTPKVANCESGTAVQNSDNTEIFAAPATGPSPSRTRTHIDITHDASNSSTARDKRYYLCVQSKISGSRASKWRLSGSVTQRKNPGS
ncbi:MAG: fibronectin type III domain-containing protein [Gammaproteobacteria bacterium]|nr:fibronectin type III domain-containing protein [Gammaproteobacteria bacterium]